MGLSQKKWLHADPEIDRSQPKDGKKPKKRRSLNPMQRGLPRWATECIVAYVFLVAVNHLLFPEMPSFRGTQPHPYFFLIVLLACRYGSRAGLVSAAIGSLLHYIWAATEFKFHLFQDFDEASRNCVVFLLTGIILGGIQNRVISKIQRLREQLRERENEVEGQVQRNLVLTSINEELEKKVLTEVQSFSSLREVSESLTLLDSGEICSNIARIVCEQLHADHATVYLWDSGRLRLMAEHSKVDRVRLVRHDIPPDGSLVGMCLSTRKPQCIRDYVRNKQRPQHIQESVMCAPLLGNGNRLVGVINVEEMPFIRITESSLNMLSLIAGLGGKALSNASMFEGLGDRLIDDMDFGVYRVSYLEHRLAEEVDRAKRSEHSFSLILVDFPRLSQQQDRNSRQEEIHILISYFRALCRDVGLISLFNDEILLAILILDRQPDKVEQMIGQAMVELRQLLPEMDRREIRFGIGHYEDDRRWQDIVSKAEGYLG